MPRPHPVEFRQRAVELPRLREKPIVRIAEDLGISESCLRNWMTQADVNEVRAGSISPSSSTPSPSATSAPSTTNPPTRHDQPHTHPIRQPEELQALRQVRARTGAYSSSASVCVACHRSRWPAAASR